MNNKWSSPSYRWLVGVVALAFATRLYGLTIQSLWFDEIVTVFLARLSWYHGLDGLLGQGIQLTPMFHWVTKLSFLIDDSDWLLRLPAAMVSLLAVPMIFKLGQRYFNDTVGFWSALTFAINPFQVWYGQELRLYALLPLAAAGSMVAFEQMLRSRGRRGIAGLILFNLLGFPAHYFMFFIPLVQFLYIVINFRQYHRLLWPWTIAQFVGVIPLVPWWLFILQRQHFAVGIGWISRPGWLEPLLTFWNFSFAYTGEFSPIKIVGLIVMLIGLGLGLRLIIKQSPYSELLILWLFIPPIVTILLSYRTISFYVDRYLLEISPILTVLVIAGLFSVPLPRVRWVALGIFLGVTTWGLGQVYVDRANFSKEDWRAIAQQIDVSARPGDVVVTCTDGQQISFAYYNPNGN